MITSFRHKGLQRFFESGSKAGIRPDHASKLTRQLAVLNNAVSLVDVPPSWKPQSLRGVSPNGRDVDGHSAIWVTGNWRLTFVFDGKDVILLDYMDYH